MNVNPVGSKPKDQRPYYRQRAMLLNAPANVARYLKYPLASRLAPVDRATLKAQQQAEKKKLKLQAAEDAQIQRDNALMEREHRESEAAARDAARDAARLAKAAARAPIGKRKQALQDARAATAVPKKRKGSAGREIKAPQRFT